MKITITLPPPRSVTRALASDWGPALQQGAKAVAAVLVAIYASGLLAGIRWRQLLAWAEQQLEQGMARLGVPGASTEDSSAVQPVSTAFKLPDVTPWDEPSRSQYQFGMSVKDITPKVKRQAPAVLPTLTRRDTCRRLRAQGLSPAKIGRELGISRSTVRRELAE